MHFKIIFSQLPYLRLGRGGRPATTRLSTHAHIFLPTAVPQNLSDPFSEYPREQYHSQQYFDRAPLDLSVYQT